MCEDCYIIIFLCDDWCIYSQFGQSTLSQVFRFSDSAALSSFYAVSRRRDRARLVRRSVSLEQVVELCLFNGSNQEPLQLPPSFKSLTFSCVISTLVPFMVA